MGITHTNPMKADLAGAFITAIDAGTPNGYILFENATDTEVARIDFSATCGTASTAGVVTFSGTPVGSDTSPATSDTIAQGSFYDGDDVKQAEATCAASGTNTIVFSSLAIATTDTVTLNTLSWTAPA